MPGRLTPAAFRKQLAAGALEPLYLVTGDDEAEMSAMASALADWVEEDVRAFNVQRFYGSDAPTTIATVLDAASTFPLLAPRRVVILIQAEKTLAGRRSRGSDGSDASTTEEAEEPGQKASDQLSALKEYAAAPHAHAVVALIGVGLEKVFESLARQAAVVICAASSDVVGVIAREHGVEFDRQAAELLRQRAGADLARLRADVERVVLYAAGRKTITRDQVADVVGRPSAAGGKALWNDVASRRTAAALRELGLELAEGAVPFMVLGLLRSVAERTVSGRDVPAAMGALMRTDLALKSSGGDPQVLLERLIVELCGMGRE